MDFPDSIVCWWFTWRERFGCVMELMPSTAHKMLMCCCFTVLDSFFFGSFTRELVKVMIYYNLISSSGALFAVLHNLFFKLIWKLFKSFSTSAFIFQSFVKLLNEISSTKPRSLWTTALWQIRKTLSHLQIDKERQKIPELFWYIDVVCWGDGTEIPLVNIRSHDVKRFSFIIRFTIPVLGWFYGPIYLLHVFRNIKRRLHLRSACFWIM